jgi:hypothetical protein
MARIPLVGPTYESRSVAVDAQRTINFYPEQVESGAGKAAVVFYPTPGLTAFCALPDHPVRGLYADLGRCWAVAGGTLCEIDALGVVTVRGTVENDGRPVTMRTNGLGAQQLFVVSGLYGYILDLRTHVLTPLTTVAQFPSGDALMGTFLDGYFIAVTPTQFHISGLFDGLIWNGEVGAHTTGTGLVAGLASHRELWLWGPVRTEVWYNAGAANFPFAPIPSVSIEYGVGAPGSVVRFDNALAWLAQNRDGDTLAVFAPQYVPQRISTHACETAWRRYATTSDALGYAYQDEGHTFYVLTFPTGGATWVYDAATRLWHERAYWDDEHGLFTAHRGRCHAQAFERHLVGDLENGTVYEMTLEAVDDVGHPIRRLRRLPHLSQENARAFFTRLEVDLETGLAGATQTEPQLMLRWSNDRGHTWSSEQWRGAGRMGAYMARAQWDRLGSARDRVFEITVTDKVPWRLIDAYLTVEGGRH